MAGKRQGVPIKECDLHSSMAALYQKDVTVTAAQALALNATPKELVAAPGAGKVLIFKGARISLDYGSAAYASLHDATIRYTDGSGQVCATLTASGFFDATSDQMRYLYPVAAAAFTPVANAKLVLFIGTGEMTTGNSPIKIKMLYRIISTDL